MSGWTAGGWSASELTHPGIVLRRPLAGATLCRIRGPRSFRITPDTESIFSPGQPPRAGSISRAAPLSFRSCRTNPPQLTLRRRLVRALDLLERKAVRRTMKRALGRTTPRRTTALPLDPRVVQPSGSLFNSPAACWSSPSGVTSSTGAWTAHRSSFCSASPPDWSAASSR